MFTYLKNLSIFSILIWLTLGRALAWGPEGPQTTGYIAQSLLTPEASIRLNQIMPGIDLGQTATWMDDNRVELKKTIPGSAQWHFYNLPVCDGKPKKDLCPNGNCAIYRIDEYTKVLSDPQATKEEKLFALRVIVHVVGDLHQPLHAGDNNDRGGNKIKVGEHTNLHSEWDNSFVKKLSKGKSSKQLADELKTRYFTNAQTWQTDTPVLWANESNQAARTVAYGELPGFTCDATYLFVEKLPESYKNASQTVVEKRLAMAGFRIAYVLNSVLEKPQSK